MRTYWLIAKTQLIVIASNVLSFYVKIIVTIPEQLLEHY